MNTTTTTHHPLIDPEDEVWGARLTSYFSAMGMVILQYDCLLTIKDEVRLVWPGDLTFPKALYYLNRYLPFAAMIFCNYQVAALRPTGSTSLCRTWMVVSGTALPLSAVASTALLTMRVTALYRGVRWFTPLLWSAFVLFEGLRTGVMVWLAIGLSSSMKYSPISNVCIPTNEVYRSSVPMMVPGIYDFVLLSLTLFKGIRSAIAFRSHSGSAIMFTLIRDELLFFSIISSLRIFNAISWLALSPSLIGVGIYAEWGLESALTSRFFLNLRNIASHQQQTTLGADAPSALSALRPRPTRKQRGQSMTDIFVDLSVDNSTFNKETDLNQGASQQTEVFDLAVIESQNQPNGDKPSLEDQD